VELFPEGGEVAVADLIAKGAVRDNAPVKVLGDGETTVAFTLKGVKASASAKSKIEAAGGSVSED
jgi:large subunit ribosomal protein L15